MTKSLALKGWLIGLIAILTFLPFKMSNMMVAVASILLIPELAKNDYTTNKIKEFIKIIIICSILSFFASTFTYNIYLGTIFTFIIAFFIYYNYTYEDRESQSMIFMIYYILILSIPMPKGDLLLRMGATIYGAILVMVLYLLLFKVDFIKISQVKINKSQDYLNNAIEDILSNNDSVINLSKALEEVQNAEDLLIKKSEKTRKNKFNLGEKILIIDLIKSIGWTLHKSDDINLIDNLKTLLDSCYLFYSSKIDFLALKENFNFLLSQFHASEDTALIKTVFSNFLSCYEDLKSEEGYKEFLTSKRKILKSYSQDFNLNYKFKFSMDSIKFNAAIKGAILNTLAVFIVFYFNILDGRWILYTITVVYLPFSEQSLKKLWQRIFGTVIGFVIFDILLYISQNKIYIIALILISLYFSIYMVDYGKRAIFITYTAIASQFLMYKNQIYYIVSFYRIGYVIIGAIVSFIVIKYIFPINFRKSIHEIFYKYKVLNLNILENLNFKKDIEMSFDDIILVNRYLFIKSNFINKYAQDETLTQIIKSQSYIVGQYKNINLLKDSPFLKNDKAILLEEINKFFDLEAKI